MTTKFQCGGCDGKGWICDTTYVRSGEWVRHEKCFGTGLSEMAIRSKLKALVKPKPKEAK